MHKICIDCGHAFSTPGKRIGDFKEYDFNNQVGKYVKELAQYNGFQVVLTQPFDNNYDIPLKQRSNLANKEKCELLISIHADASSHSSAEGHHAFYWHTSKNGKKLAELWNENANGIMLNKDRCIRESKPNEWTNFHMVRETNMPSILIEHAFYTNPKELELLKSDNFRRLCARTIVKTICDYFNLKFKDIENKGSENMKQIDQIPEWAKVAVKDVMEKCIMNGYPDDTFKPNNSVTRAEIAVIIHNLLKYIGK